MCSETKTTSELTECLGEPSVTKRSTFWVGYTYNYRAGGVQLRRVAETMVYEKRRAHPNANVILCEVNSKSEFIDAMRALPSDTLSELHFIGHSGMYGPMFGTTKFPEQLSPHEWRELDLSFASGGEAYFHACRTGRWFAAFFARTFQVPAYGYHWYTTFSQDPMVFKWAGRVPKLDTGRVLPPLYMRGCPGRKSHGLFAGLKKYLGRVKLEQPLRFDPPRFDPSRPDPSRLDPSRLDPSRPDPSRPDPSRPDPSRPDPPNKHGGAHTEERFTEERFTEERYKEERYTEERYTKERYKEEIDMSYDPVADLYADVFTDIRARRDEWRWILNHIKALEPELSILDVGCGNGALLRALSEDAPASISSGHGVDTSRGMIRRARIDQADFERLQFHEIDGPTLPFADHTFDVAVSFLSFRYLDWDPLMRELIRVLKPGGRLFIIDMVTAPLKLSEAPIFIRSKLTYERVKRDYPVFHQRLKELVQRPEWRQMLHYNPIRAQHEMVWYLESRFAGTRVEMINAGWTNRVLAFDSGPITSGYIAPQSYP